MGTMALHKSRGVSRTMDAQILRPHSSRQGLTATSTPQHDTTTTSSPL